MDMAQINQLVGTIDGFVWGPVMLILLVGTGIYMTVSLRFLTWRNLPYALKSVFGHEARTTSHGSGDVSPFSALMTALAATIGTGNIVGVATAMFAGGPGALVWMWLSACFGLSTKFSECMLGFKYREVNAKGEMKGGPMFTMKNGFKNRKAGLVMGTLFAFFAVIASFGIGNMTQANSISTAVQTTFGISTTIVGAVLTVLTLAVIVGGITSISKVSSVVVPGMAAFSTHLGIAGSYIVSIGIILFAFSTILGWEYNGEKAWEYLFGTHKYNIIYRVAFSLVVFVGATQTLDLVWNLSDIANALMAIPNLISILVLSPVIKEEVFSFQEVIRQE